jgi:hypothetical protein
MASAADKRQLDAIKNLVKRWSADPVQLRFAVVLGLFGVGLFGMVRPLSARLDAARAANKEAHAQSRMAEELRNFYDQGREYGTKVAVSSDLVDWQNYVLEKLRCTSATLISLEPKSTLVKQPFTVLNMELVARGTSFEEFADFTSRLEHGERCVRIEKLRLERQQTSIYLTMLIRGLVRAAPETKPKDAKAKYAKGARAGKPESKDAASDEKTVLAKSKPAQPEPSPAPAANEPDTSTSPTDSSADAPTDAQPEASGDAPADGAEDATASAPEGGGDG